MNNLKTITIPANSIGETPLDFFEGTEENQKIHFLGEKNSYSSVIMRKKNTTESFTKTEVTIFAEENTQMDFYRIYDDIEKTENQTNFKIFVKKNGVVNFFHLLFGGKSICSHIQAKLLGENANFELNGLIFGGADQHHEFFSEIIHTFPNCKSREVVKTILKDNSRCVFNGLIIVEKDAQKSDAQMINRNLLLSDNARIHTNPQLKIYADDVKCSHGATSGQIDREVIFYFLSRGISEKDALQIMINGFSGEIIEKIKYEPLRTELMQRIQ